MFKTLTDRIARDKDYPERCFTLDIYARVLDGVIYDHLTYAFHEEKNNIGEYIRLRDRRPSVRHNICRIVVDDSVSLLFSEGHFPGAESDDRETQRALCAIIKGACLNEVMVEAATIGSVGSAAIHMQALKQKDGSHRLFYKPYSTEYLTPVFKREAPDELASMTETYKVKGSELAQRGYRIGDEDLAADFWFERRWDETDEIWFVPWLVRDADRDEKNFAPERDAQKSVRHGLGFVPWVWIRNLPGKLRLIGGSDGPLTYSGIDGACTFAAAIETMIEIDYLLSQGGRGLKYAMDPLLMIKEPAAPQDDQFVKSPENALVVSGDGDAKMLEIGGSAFSVVLDYCRGLRELGLENIHGNRAEPSKLSSAQSGRAMELMNQALIWLADKLRISYGEGALRKLLRMALIANEKYPLCCCGETITAKADAAISLRWPRWYQPSYQDRQSVALTLKTHADAGHMSRETAVRSIAADYDVADVHGEIAAIEADGVGAGP
jgi:hypothetical protein